MGNSEHFVTLFDSGFLPFGLSLHESLMEHAQPFQLWVVCMDDQVREQLEILALPNVSLIPLASLETPELLAVKPGRNRAEYCWTLTSFTFRAVFERAPEAERVTYLDADLFFFAAPSILLSEFDQSGKDVLITEHGYAPEYAGAHGNNGRFCVQFVTFRNTPAAEQVRSWWQERCVEWCFDRVEDGKFGDQAYLDAWPEMFPGEVHILRQTERTVAPWNARYLERKSGGKMQPVFYHFHGFRIVGPDTLRLYTWFRIGKEGLRLYHAYAGSIVRSLGTMQRNGFTLPVQQESLPFWKKWLRRLSGRHGYYRFRIEETACSR